MTVLLRLCIYTIEFIFVRKNTEIILATFKLKFKMLKFSEQFPYFLQNDLFSNEIYFVNLSKSTNMDLGVFSTDNCAKCIVKLTFLLRYTLKFIFIRKKYWQHLN